MSSQYDNSSGFTIAHYALDFDGTNDNVSANGVALALDSSTNLPLSVSAWVNPDDHATSTLVFGFFKQSAGEPGFKQGPSVWWLTNGLGEVSGRFRYYQEPTLIRTSTLTYFINKWHHVVLSIGSDRDGILYVNGLYDSALTFPGAYNVGDLTEFIIGVDCDEADGCTQATQFFNGQIDEVAVWNDNLTSAEVTAIYNNGYPLDVSTDSGNYESADNLTGYYRFNEGSGTSLQDSSSNSNTGTITGATWTTGSVSE
jgi:hypothetical protein